MNPYGTREPPLKIRVAVIAVLGGGAFLAACGGGDSSSQPTQNPSYTPIASATVSPTASTGSATPYATATPMPTATYAPTPNATSTPKGVQYPSVNSEYINSNGQQNRMTIPVSSNSDLESEIEFSAPFNRPANAAIMKLINGAVIVSPFDGDVIDVNTYPGPDGKVGTGTQYITLFQADRAYRGTFILPKESGILVKKGQSVKRGNPLANFNGGNLGGQSAYMEVFFGYMAGDGNPVEITNPDLWVSRVPSIYIP